MKVTLDPRQRAFARHVASRRFARGGIQQYGTQGGFGLDLGSCEAELACSIALGRPWSAAFGKGGADVGDDWEVRWTSYPRGRLIVHPSDPDGWRAVLVTGASGAYRLVGWLEVVLAKRPWYVDQPRAGGKAYFVPQADLRREFESV